MKRLISETIPLHTINDDDLKNDWTVTEKEFWEQVGQWGEMIEDLYNEDPYTYYLEHCELNETPEEFVKKIEDIYWQQVADREEKFYRENIDNIRAIEKELKDLANSGQYKEFWECWDYHNFSDYYKDVHGHRPHYFIQDNFDEETVNKLREACPW